MWGRDGRLAAHPMPGQSAAVDPMGNLAGGSADKNATFDNEATKLNPLLKKDGGGSRSAAASGAALLGRSTTPSSDGSFPESLMPRTATALENSMMKKWT